MRPALVSDEQRPEGPDKRLLILLVIAVLLVGLSLDGLLARLFRGGPGPHGLAEALPAKPRLLPPPAPVLEEPSRAAHRKPAKTAVTTGQFMKVLLQETPKPLAAKVARAFVQDPALRKAWSDFRQDSGYNAPARDFLRAVLRVPEFRRLMLELRGDPDFRGAFSRLTRNPEFVAALRPGQVPGGWVACGDGRFGQTRGAAGITCIQVCSAAGLSCRYRAVQADHNACLPANPAQSGACSDVFQAARFNQCVCAGASRLTAYGAISPSKGGVSAPARGPLARPGSPAATRRQDGKTSNDRPVGRKSQFLSGEAGGPDSAKEDRPRNTQERRDGGTGPYAHDVTPMARISTDAVPDRTVGGYLASMIAVMPMDIRKELEQACQEDDENCDPLTVCELNDRFLKACQDACAKSPSTCSDELRIMLMIGSLDDESGP